MSWIERNLINEDEPTSILDQYSHEGPEQFSGLNCLRVEGLNWSLDWFLPTAVQLVSKNLSHLISLEMDMSFSVVVNLISN